MLRRYTRHDKNTRCAVYRCGYPHYLRVQPGGERAGARRTGRGGTDDGRRPVDRRCAGAAVDAAQAAAQSECLRARFGGRILAKCRAKGRGISRGVVEFRDFTGWPGRARVTEHGSRRRRRRPDNRRPQHRRRPRTQRRHPGRARPPARTPRQPSAVGLGARQVQVPQRLQPAPDRGQARRQPRRARPPSDPDA